MQNRDWIAMLAAKKFCRCRIACKRRSTQVRDPPLLQKPRADITKSPRQWPHLCPPETLKWRISCIVLPTQYAGSFYISSGLISTHINIIWWPNKHYFWRLNIVWSPVWILGGLRFCYAIKPECYSHSLRPSEINSKNKKDNKAHMPKG